MSESDDGASYAPLALASGADSPPADARSFLAAVREHLERLNPARARNTWAIYAADLGLVIVVPLDSVPGSTSKRGSLHLSIQLRVATQSRSAIEGAWTDAHYAWDYVPHPDFVVGGADLDSRAKALDWFATELRRPITRRDWIVFGITAYSRWCVDGAGWCEGKGFFPVGLVLAKHPTRSVRAGYVDPWG